MNNDLQVICFENRNLPLSYQFHARFHTHSIGICFFFGYQQNILIFVKRN